ncbi:MAG TPA: alanyl-tRNA editing protein [Thermoplasmata archaeon]|nr:alanyl-tRNA editing protein [Thermoplasmata archaeon]
MTELAYLADLPSAYVRAFRSRVTALPPGGVVLERTYFYPTGGGQPADHGVLRIGEHRWEVTDVGRSGSAVVHRIRAVGGAPRAPPIGGEVEGELDWARRYRHMRLHTGQHLLSARVFSRTGLRTVKANLSGATASLDLEGELDPALIRDLESDLGEALRSPHTVSIRQVPRAEWDARPTAPRSGLVPLAPQVDPVRVVEIEAEDACPCGGTHVRSTAEIGRTRLAPPVSRPGAGSRLVFTLVETELTAPPA